MTRRRPQRGPRWTSAAARRLLTLAGNPPSVEDAIDVVTSRLLEGVQCPPTDLEAIRPRLNITGFCGEDIAGSGELRRDGEGFRIVYSLSLSPTRRRFTIAHEMAHALFETTGRNCPRTGAELERICDKISAEILMPRRQFTARLGLDLSVRKVMEMSQLFRTSISATAIRCAELMNVSVFGIEGDTIIWSFGVIRSGSIHRADHNIRELYAKLKRGDAVNDVIYLESRRGYDEWRVEAMPIGDQERSLFLLKPTRVPRKPAL